MRSNLLAQKYTYNKLHIGLNISLPFSPQLGAFDSHKQASGRPLVEFLTTPLKGICEVQLNGSDLFHQHNPPVLDGVQVRT